MDGRGGRGAHPEYDGSDGEVEEALWPANSTTASCGSGEVSGKLASRGLLVVFN